MIGADEDQVRAEWVRPRRRVEGGFKAVPLSVRTVLSEYQCDAASGWANREYYRWLVAWAGEFIKFYELQTRGGCSMAVPVMKIVPRSMRTIVSYRAKRDGLGIAGTIEVNENLLGGKTVPEETLLAHLLKALIRAWERERSPDEVFVRERVKRLREKGVIVTGSGKEIRIEGGGSFEKLLSERGIKKRAG